nr:MAG TPA: hypothetical protein [Caudoviricetes sp.]
MIHCIRAFYFKKYLWGQVGRDFSTHRPPPHGLASFAFIVCVIHTIIIDILLTIRKSLVLRIVEFLKPLYLLHF